MKMMRAKPQRWHLTYASDGRFPIFPDERLRRRAIHKLARLKSALLLFSIVEEHLHVVNQTAPDRVGRQAQAIQSMMQPLVAVKLQPAFKRIVRDRGHLAWLVRYHVRQPLKHNVPEHAALWSGSCFQDLVGARYVPGLSLHIAQALSQYSVNTALSHLQLTPAAVAPLHNDAIRALGARRIVAAAAAATAAGPCLDNCEAASAHARRTAVLLSRKVGISNEEIAWALPITIRSVQRAAPREGDDRRMRAARVRLALEQATGTHAPLRG